MAKKRATLPKNFEQMLETASVEALIQVFDKCAVDARGGYSKGTALSFGSCPHELAVWLVAQGLDVEAPDQYEATPLQSRASSCYHSNIKSLLELGADVNRAGNKGSALHRAASSQCVENVQLLLEHGADVHAVVSSGRGPHRGDYSPLELCLQQSTNAFIKSTLGVVQLLLAAGAEKTEKAKQFVTEIGETFEQYRPNFYDEDTERSSDALAQLYEIFDVEPVPKRVVYDGRSPITVEATQWQGQHEELWALLVPPSGPAKTVQGEVIRITGKVARELLDNSAANWDAEYKKLIDAYLDYIKRGTPLNEAELQELSKIANEVRAGQGELVYRMSQLGVQWVLANPSPMALTEPEYRR